MHVHNLVQSVVQNLEISRFPDSASLIQNIKCLTLKPVLKYRKHSSIISVQSKPRDVASLSFVEVDIENISETYRKKSTILKNINEADIKKIEK